jgi:ribosomal protein L13E
LSSSGKKEPKAKPKKPAEKATPAKPKVETEAPPRPAEAPRPKGQAPRAMVSSRHEGAMIEREARGFSIGELGGAGFTLGSASRLGLATDIRRRTVLEKNVESLKGWFSPPKQAPSPKPMPEPSVVEAPKPKKRAPAKKTKK